MTFILVLLAGVVDLGRMFFTFVSLRDAAQEGAIYASFCPTNFAGIENRVRDTSSNPIDLTGDNIFVDRVCSPNTNCLVAGDNVTITVRMDDFTFSMPFLGGSSFPLEASVTDPILTSTMDCSNI